MRGPLEARQVLLEHQVLHNVIRLPRRIPDADELPAALGLAAQDCVAVRCYRTDAAPISVIVAAGMWPDSELLAAALALHSAPRDRPRRATRDEVNIDTDYQAGLVCPLALPGRNQVFADVRLLRSPVIYLPTGDPGTAFGMRTRDLLTVTGAKVAVLTRRLRDEVERETDLTDRRLPAWAN